MRVITAEKEKETYTAPYVFASRCKKSPEGGARVWICRGSL